MRRLMIMVALVSLLVGVFATAAYARTFTCTDVPCRGTTGPDTITERPGYGQPDEIYGLRGADTIDAGFAGGDVDLVWGGRGADTISTDDGDDDDEVRGQAGFDTCYVDLGDLYFGCEVVYVDGDLVT